MVFGKREKLVAGGVVAALIMAALHLMVFSPRVQSYSKAIGDRDEQQNKLKGMKSAQAKDLDKLTSATTATLDMLTSGVASLGMSENDAFVLPTFGDIGAPPGVAPTEEFMTKLESFGKVKIDQEMVLVLDEVRKLQELCRKAAAGNTTRFSFIDGPPLSNNWRAPQGWALPLALPQNITRDTHALWDGLAKIDGIKRGLNSMTAGTVYYKARRVDYYNAMRILGVDYFYVQGNLTYPNQTFYNWPGANYYGEFVPAIDKLALANLLLDQIKQFEAKNPPLIINQRRLDLNFVLDVVDFKMRDYDLTLDGLRENKLYFMYEELRNLNRMLAMALDLKLADVSQISFDGYSFLRPWEAPGTVPDIPADLTKLSRVLNSTDYSSDEMKIGESAKVAAAPTEEESLDGGMDYEEGGGPKPEGEGGGGEDNKPKALPPGATAPRPEETGVALPIKIVYQATNDKVWKYIYDMLRAQPMTELQRMSFRTLSQFAGYQNNPNVESTVTFVMVPKMFSAVDDLRKQLQAIKGTPAATPPPAEAAK